MSRSMPFSTVFSPKRFSRPRTEIAVVLAAMSATLHCKAAFEIKAEPRETFNERPVEQGNGQVRGDACEGDRADRSCRLCQFGQRNDGKNGRFLDEIDGLPDRWRQREAEGLR